MAELTSYGRVLGHRNAEAATFGGCRDVDCRVGRWTRPPVAPWLQGVGADVAPQKVTANGVLFYVSCPTSTFCVSPSLQGPVYVYSSGRWSAEQPRGVSRPCPAALCLHGALELSGKAVVLDGRHWSDPVGVFPGNHALAAKSPRQTWGTVSCPVAGWCMLTEPTGVVVSYDAGHWSKPINCLPPSTGAFMSCPAIGRCMMSSATGPSDLQLRRLDRRAADQRRVVPPHRTDLRHAYLLCRRQ